MSPRLAEACARAGIREGDPMWVVLDEMTDRDRVLTREGERALVERVASASGNAVLAAERERNMIRDRRERALVGANLSLAIGLCVAGLSTLLG